MTSMIMSFTRNDAAAKSLDGGTHISQSGAYTGQITQAAMFMSDKGSQYLHITFKADDGRVCTTPLFLTKTTGEESFGRKILDALLVVCGAQNAAVTEGKIYIRDRNAPGGMRVDPGYRLPAVESKHIGLVLQRVNKKNRDGSDGYDMMLLTPFDASTRKVAREILDNATEAKLLDQRLKNLKDRDAKPVDSSSQPPANHPAVAAPMDDDPPF